MSLHRLHIRLISREAGVPWADNILEGFSNSEPILTNDGFRLISKSRWEYWLELREHGRGVFTGRGVIFAYAHEPGMISTAQVLRVAVVRLYDEVVDALLAA